MNFYLQTNVSDIQRILMKKKKLNSLEVIYFIGHAEKKFLPSYLLYFGHSIGRFDLEGTKLSIIVTR